MATIAFRREMYLNLPTTDEIFGRPWRKRCQGRFACLVDPYNKGGSRAALVTASHMPGVVA